MTRLLIANRGEIARRIIRTAHRMGVTTVAVFSDADAQALHVKEASASVALGGNASADTYLRIDKLIAAARATGADSVHPGYGFLSENADFAQAVIDAGLTWVGPPPQAIRDLGSKSAIKRRAHEAGVPCLPSHAGEDQSLRRFIDEAERIGYPVMVKAAAGGGGRGMRLVHRASDLPAALDSAASEAKSAFGSDELLIERALLSPRHVEVQVFADARGHCIHLGERDCSVQRRHQKIIEESPSPAVDAPLRERMGSCAVRLAQSAGYVGAGTVEFLLEGREFFLMEMNTRLQVEHPVTEALTGFDLVEWQIRIARGEPLPVSQDEVRLNGHAIEVRLCAEDEHFTPHAGTVQRFVAPQGVRVDHALHDGAVVPPHYDSMIGKLIAHASTRPEAIATLASALDQTVVLGLPTNRALLAQCLRDTVFGRGEALIPFLSTHGDDIRARLHAAQESLLPHWLHALWQAQSAGRGTRLTSPFNRPLRVRHRGRTVDATLNEQGARLCVTVDGNTTEFDLHSPAQSARTHDGWHLQIDGIDTFIEDASFEPATTGHGHTAPTLKAPFSGKVVALHARAGQPVSAGEVLLVIESMKLEHAISAPRDVVIASLAVEPGQQVSSQQLLLSFA
ncbi:biotin/lipoyl-binding protein [Albitalea terrae]|uniref:Biotin/lipoyl-binding protein n=1 Tax=Piscinibacter terrae TaxID=2496871 RepID=A0A3N7HWK8_9BURK|nr:biotin carboxylase N-terminal domain-containing protein [Albitalea terrae]RQP26780.1 biotin/lipoyl-binding protein [Albitalea terrae]